jgi:hypothetical protein
MASEQAGQKKQEEVEVNNGEKQSVIAGQENWRKWSQLVAQAWADEKLKQRLIANPAAVLQEHGIEVPAGVDMRVVENTDKVSYLMLPPKPAGAVAELTSGQLSGIAGGFCCSLYCNTPSVIKSCDMQAQKYLDSASV